MLASIALVSGAAQANAEGAYVPVTAARHPNGSRNPSFLQEKVSTQSVAAAFADARAAQRAAAKSRMPELLENWVDAGLASGTSLSDSEVDALAASITEDAYGSELHAIADLAPSRFIANEGNVLMADYVRSEFESLGLTIWSEPLPTAGTQLQTWIPAGETRTAGILGRLEGTDLADEVVLVGAHFDSVNWEQTSGTAPGVDDNGSGIALMLQAAKALVGRVGRPRRSVLFAAFNGEELGLYGSKEIARLAATGKYGELKAALIADEVAWPGQGTPSSVRQAIFETVGTVDGTTAMLDTLAHKVRDGDGVDGFKVNKHGFASDHISFLDTGVPTVLLIEGDNVNHSDEWGHSARDTFDHVDFAFGASMSRVALRAAATLAWPQ